MPVPADKSALIDAIETNYKRLAADLATVPQDVSADKTLEGHAKGTVISVHNLVAYLVGWNELVLKWHERRQAGLAVDFPETGFKWNQLGLLAQKFYADYAALPFPELLRRLDVAKADIIALINARTEAELYGTPWYEAYTMGRMIQFNTSSPYANARVRLRKWKKQMGLA